MASKLNPYINLRGQAREALEHYRTVFGGEVQVMTFGEMGGPGVDPESVMHGQLETTDGFTLMVSDVPPGMELAEGSSLSISLSGDDEAQLRGWWDGLSAGATVHTPLDKQVWGDLFGALTDRFGVSWLVDIGQPAS